MTLALSFHYSSNNVSTWNLKHNCAGLTNIHYQNVTNEQTDPATLTGSHYEMSWETITHITLWLKFYTWKH
jgi:hypothetical protein